MNSTRRGAPVPVAPVLMMSVILPRLAEGLPPLKAPKLVPGLLYIGWLKRLKAAARKFMPNFSDRHACEWLDTVR